MEKFNNWSIEFFNKKVKKDTFSLPVGIRAELEYLFSKIIQEGPNFGMPFTKPFGKGLFELRAKGQEGIGRSFFCTLKGQRVIILHSFVKKSQKTPAKELKLAQSRKKEVENGT